MAKILLKGKVASMTISISCIETVRHDEAVKAIESTLKCVNISKIYWFSNRDFPKDKNVGCEIVNIKIKPFDRTKSFNEAYSHLALELIPETIETDYNLIVQYDGYAVNKNAWTNNFLKYDYIGSLVKWFHHYPYKNGNGGFCLRSKKLYNAMKAIGLKYTFADLIKYKNFDRLLRSNLFKDKFTGKRLSEDLIKHKNFNRLLRSYLSIDKFAGKSLPEDFIITEVYKEQLIKEYGIKFAPAHISNRFSIQSNLSSSWLCKSLGFHGPHLFKLYSSIFPSILKEEKK